MFQNAPMNPEWQISREFVAQGHGVCGLQATEEDVVMGTTGLVPIDRVVTATDLVVARGLGWEDQFPGRPGYAALRATHCGGRWWGRGGVVVVAAILALGFSLSYVFAYFGKLPSLLFLARWFLYKNSTCKVKRFF